MTYEFVQNQGVVVPDTAEIYSQVLSEWQAAFGAINADPSQPQGVMIAAETLAREAVANNNALLANQINPNMAQGVFLDAICALFGIERAPATPSKVAGVQLAGVASTAVPAGTIALDMAGNRWRSTRAVTLPATVDFESVETGAFPLPVGALNQLETQILGLETVYNPVAGVPGTSEQTDSALRVSRRQRLARQSISVSEAMASAVYDVAGVTSVAYRENTSSAPATIDGITLDPHSIWVCADGGDPTAIATALLRAHTGGAGFNGAQVVQVTDPHSRQTYPVKFDRPAYVPVSVTVTGRVLGDRSVNPEAIIPAAVATWARGDVTGDPGLQIGTDVSTFEIGFAVNAALPGFQVTAVELRRAGVPVVGNTLAISLLERALIGENDVQVILL